MGKTKGFIRIIASLLVTALLTLSLGIYCVFAREPADKAVNTDEISPDIINVGGVPISQQKYDQKFGIYTHISYENGKSIATLFTEEQAWELKYRRENGEPMRLTNEEILYLISDTINLFKEYDEVRISNCNYVKSYDTKGKYKKGVYEVASCRIETLCSFVALQSTGQGDVLFVIGSDSELVDSSYLSTRDWISVVYYFLTDEKDDAHFVISEIKEILSGTVGSGFWFYKGNIYFVYNLSDANRGDLKCLFDSNTE